MTHRSASAASLKDAILAAERENVIVYTVSTAETTLSPTGPPVGTKALNALAEQTGGSSFVPGSAGNLKRGLADLQEVIRSRYLISYKPARFELDGHYRRIEVTTRRSGHKLVRPRGLRWPRARARGRNRSGFFPSRRPSAA